MATRTDNSTGVGEEAKVVYALIDGRWNAEKSASLSSSALSPATDDDDGGPTPIQRRGRGVANENSPSSSHYYSISLPISKPSPSNNRRHGHEGTLAAGVVTLTTLEQWYEYYARRYPSRGFLERRRQEWEAEEERRRQQLAKESRKKQGKGGMGMFLRLFFGWGAAPDDNADGTDTITTPDEIREMKNDDNAWEDEGASSITSMVGDSQSPSSPHAQDLTQGRHVANHVDDGMCGTASLLDKSAVAKEALAFHRFHLVSERRAICCAAGKEKRDWNVVLPVRQSVGEVVGEGQGNVPYYCIVGYGQIAEFPSLDAAAMDSQTSIDGANIRLTSDWQHLLAIANHHKSNGQSMPHDLRHCRAASIGRDCLMVSWGRGDGLVVFYRRMPEQRRPSNNGANCSELMLEIGWQVVAISSPSKAVTHAASSGVTPDPYRPANNVENDSDIVQERRLYDSGLLYTTDLLPMIINGKNNCTSHQQQYHSPPTTLLPSSAVLAISRLGGFVELLPIPPWIFQPQLRSTPQQSDFLPNLTTTSKTTAFSTSQHHLDAMSMDAYRTSVSSSSEWDEKRHPEGPPAEFVLAVSGRSSRSGLDGNEDSFLAAGAVCLTMWGITAIHAFPHQQQQGQGDSGREPSFDLRVQRIGYMDLENVGADSSLFLSNATVDHWSSGGCYRSPMVGYHKRRKIQPLTMPNSTVTATAPLVSLRFTPDDSNCNSTVLLAALDYNGGVSMIDCTETVRAAEHTLDELYNAAPATDEKNYPRNHLLCNRERTMTISSKGKRLQTGGVARASQIEWWSNGSVNGPAFNLASYSTWIPSRTNDGAKPFLALVRLQQYMTASEGEEVTSPKNNPRDVFCIPISTSTASPSVVALLPMLGRQSHHDETLSFLQIAEHRSNNHLSIQRIQKFPEPDKIISALLHRGLPSQALDVARRFGGAEHFGGRLMNECRIRLWEDQRDVKALRLVSDDDYVICQAMHLLDQGAEGNKINMELAGLSLDDLLEIFKETLARCHGPSVEASRLTNSIRQLGTFTLLLNHFTGVTRFTTAKGPTPPGLFTWRFLCDFQHKPPIDIATCAAAQGDIGALTMLLVRHPVSMQDRLQLLNLIPLGMEISLYGHLLPCCITTDSGEEKEDVQQVFLPNFLSKPQFLNSVQLFTYFSEQQSQGSAAKSSKAPALKIFTDDFDRDLIMSHYWDGINGSPKFAQRNDPTSTKEEVAMWFLRRAIKSHKETGQIFLMKEVLQAGLIRLGFNYDGAYEISSLNCVSKGYEEVNSSAVGKLIYLYSAASLFWQTMFDKLKEVSSYCQPSIESLSEGNNHLFVSIIQFCSMELSETVPFVLESSTHNSVSMFQKHVAHFAKDDQCLGPMDSIGASKCSITSKDLANRLERDMMELCLKKIKLLERESNTNPSASCEDVPSRLSLKLEQSLSVCFEFASLGTFSQSGNSGREDRLLDFAERVFYSVLDVVKGEWYLMAEGGVIGAIFKILELLPPPAHALNTSGKGKKTAPSLETTHQPALEILQFKLIVVQLCCKWRGRREIARELWNFLRSNFGIEEKNVVCMGHLVIAHICRGFCDMVARDNDGLDGDDKGFPAPKQDFDLLFDFVSDVDEFDQRYFSSGVQLSGCLGKYLLVPLLSQHSFLALKSILKLRSAWFCEDFLRAAVASFIRDASSRPDDRNFVTLACRDILGPTAEFDCQQRMLDAKQFMTRAMKLDSFVLEQLFSSSNHSDKPTALLQTLLATTPRVILLGCEFWSDELMAINASVDASVYFTSQICESLNNVGGSGPEGESSHGKIPPMPGAIVMQLANILGVHNLHDLLFVKRGMVDAALKTHLGPAAVAVCYSMLCDVAFTKHEHDNSCDTTTQTNQHELQALDCVKVVAESEDSSVSSIQLKKDMCCVALRLISTTDASLYYELLDLFKHLEYQFLALQADSILSVNVEHPVSETEGRGGTQTSNSDFLVFKAAGLVASQARYFVDCSGTKSRTVSRMVSNNFYDRSMIHVLNNFKESSLGDLLHLLSSLPDKSSLVVTSEAIFSGVISMAFEAGKASHTALASSANILMMVEFGLSFLTELLVLGHDSASLIINQTWKDFSAKKQQEISTSPDYSIQPDMSVVQRLIDRGYGWNAARRAVIMTNNQGYSSALTWAVSHFQDSDFNSPILFLHADLSACVDQHLIFMTGEYLRSVLTHIEDKRTCSSSAAINLTTMIADHPPQERNGNGTVLSDAATTSLSIKSENVIASTKKPLITSPTSQASLSSPYTGDKHSGQSTPKYLLRTERPRPPNSSESFSSVEGSLTSRASVKRQIQRGNRLGTQKLSAEERKKLAIHGKRLLDAARAKNKRVIAPPSTITTCRHAPP